MPASVEHSSKFGDQLQPHQDELLQLGELAGVYMDTKIFKILVEFLNMGVDPNTIFGVLKAIRRSSARTHSRHNTPRI